MRLGRLTFGAASPDIGHMRSTPLRNARPRNFFSSRLTSRPALLAILAASWAGLSLGGCAHSRAMAAPATVHDPAIRAAQSQVSLTALGVVVPDDSGRATSLGAVRPVTCIRLANGDLLTAAHTLPGDRLGASHRSIDPTTGLMRMDRDTPENDSAPMVVIVDGVATTARVSASDALRYASSGTGTRASVPADWAVLTTDRTISAPSPVRRIGTPTQGERCFLIGYPPALMDRNLFEAHTGVAKATDLRWLDAEPVVIEGVIAETSNDRITIATDGMLGARGRGLSGGGLFVVREGEPVLVGIVVQASKLNALATACPLPEAVAAGYRSGFASVSAQLRE